MDAITARKIIADKYTYYNSGATAPAYDPYTIPAPVRKEKVWQPSRVNVAARARAAHTARMIILIECMALAAVTLLASSFIVMQYERIAASNTQVNNLKSEIEELSTECDSLSAKVECAVDIASVQTIASEKLNMGYPTDDQIVTIDYAVQDYTEKTAQTASLAAAAATTAKPLQTNTAQTTQTALSAAAAATTVNPLQTSDDIAYLMNNNE